ncbi:S8 family peptidase [Sinimarinibacterium thermocellulolyticum]|uniref:S8 family peptidase n=1 Tax=Sinimarinibacterium thermocellulolyticum TaxID=3170016 RepID=A0ABV2A825_9GAMM
MGNPRSSLPLAGLLWLPLTVAAFSPDGGELSSSNPALVAEGGPYLVSNPTGLVLDPVCTGDGVSCDTFSLGIALDDAYRAAHPRAEVVIGLEWSNAGDDLDLYVRDEASGALLGASASSDPGERVRLRLADLPTPLRIEAIPFLVTGSTSTLSIALIANPEDGGGGDACEQTAGDIGQMDTEVAIDLANLAQNAIYGAFVRFAGGTRKQQDHLLQRLGLTPTHDFRRYVSSVFVTGPVAAFTALLNEPLVARIEYNQPLRYFGSTGVWATRVRVAQEPVAGGPYYDAQGRILTGAGVSLGIIDSGLFGPHPDFADNLLHNFKLLVPGLATDPLYVDIGPLDSESQVGGHGTHVTGTVAGSGAASDGLYPVAEAAPNIRGTYAGVAPGARIIHWANGAAILVLDVTSAYRHLLDNLDRFDPPLRAVNNSYGDAAGSQYDPGSTASCLIKEIVDRGVVMVFAAGNDGGDGSVDNTSSYCKDPTPGVICVASYDDAGTGRRDGALSGFSSRALKGAPENYPDVSAPGDLITSTCAQVLPSQAICLGGSEGPIEGTWLPWYGTISGTSMAAPHVTGAVGLIAQAHPDLTPAQIEEAIKRNARKIGSDYEPDPKLPGSTTHFAYGAGLLDLPAVLDALDTPREGLPPLAQEWVVLDGDTETFVSDPGADIRRLTMQEGALDDLPGIQYRLTLGAPPTSRVAYRVSANVAGLPVSTTVVASSDGVEIPEGGAGNTAVAQRASLDGNVLSFFVPYAQLGFPEPGEPIHNIRAYADGALFTLDAAPSAADVLPEPPDQPELPLVPDLLKRPMYGRAFTTRLEPGTPPPSTEKSCELPGLTQFTSPPGVTGNVGLPSGQDDLRQLWIAEPAEMPGKLVFTIKVASLAFVPPLHRWYAYFSLPDDPNAYFVAMDNTTTGVRFIYGTRGQIPVPAVGGVGTFTTLGELDAASTFDADGTIRLVLDKSALGIDTGTVLGSIAASIRQTTPVNGIGLTTDSGAAARNYTVVGNVCTTEGGDGGGSTGGSGGGPGEPDRGRFGGALPASLLLLFLGLAAWRVRRPCRTGT